MFEDANQDHDVEPLAGAGDLGERHRADVDGIEPRRGGCARWRGIEADHVGKPALADVCQQPAAGAADVEDAHVRRGQIAA